MIDQSYTGPVNASLALSSYYSSILRPISISALEGILNRSMACAELRAINENNSTHHRDNGFRCLRLIRSLRSM
jgi:hypothetical protein